MAESQHSSSAPNFTHPTAQQRAEAGLKKSAATSWEEHSK